MKDVLKKYLKVTQSTTSLPMQRGVPLHNGLRARESDTKQTKQTKYAKERREEGTVFNH